MVKMMSTKSFVYRGTRREKDAVFDVLPADVRMCRGFGAIDYVEPAAPAAAAATTSYAASDDKPKKAKKSASYETRDVTAADADTPAPDKSAGVYETRDLTAG